jgi:para-nitrobenzyl esterase
MTTETKEAAAEHLMIDRRTALKHAALLGAAAATSVLPCAVSAQATQHDVGQPRDSRYRSVTAQASAAVVQTANGTVAGYRRKGIYAFKGIPYGDTTAGANRFCPPQKPKPWQGVRSSRHYGFVAPQDKGTGRQNDEEAFMFQWNDSVEGEDCLRVNIWTPGINDNKKRPVMVWLHGGGFTAGSGHDLPAFDGENLARRGDVVVITLNHRLNLLGFLDLSQYGSQYARSGNVGMLDIVAALEWVRDNITEFGGNPSRVLIFGQSGGGGKVSTLMGMPAAKGLFHGAIVESGSFTFANTPDRSRKLSQLVVAELGLGASTLGRIQELPYSELRRASETVLAKANSSARGVVDVRSMGQDLGFSPVTDGTVLPATPFSPTAPVLSATVPMIIGTTLNEFVTGINHPEYELMSERELQARTAAMFPGRGRKIIAAFRERVPGAAPFDVWSRIASAPVRQAAIRQAAAKAALNGAPAYLYWFTWRTPIFDGRPRAFHCAEIPFVFCNTDRCENMTGGGTDASELSARMADAWIAFARTGNPNHPGMPEWSSFSPTAVPTMMFDNVTEQLQNPDRDEQEAIAHG